MPFDLSQFLGEGGPIARRLDGYEPRPQQIEMALAVERAMESRARLVVEAGTGVGKSFAYLLPAIKQILAKSQRVVIATHTISLQEQLIEKDIPLLRAVIPDEFSAVLVKGRGNYVSLRRLRLASERQDRLFSDDAARHALHQIEDWAATTRDGSLATLPQLERPEVWDYARSDSHNCMGKKCDTYNQCFYQAARRRMENGDLLVCNHAIFFADLALRAQGAMLLPPYDHVILDEAHGVEDVAADHFGVQLAESRVQHLLRLLYRHRTGHGFLTTLKLKDHSTELIDRTLNHILHCGDEADRFFDSIHAWLARHAAENGRAPAPGIVENTLSEPMEQLGRRLALLKERAAKEPDQFELASYAQRALDIAREAEILIEQRVDDCVYWVETSGSSRYRARRPRIAIRCAPIEVGPILREALFGKEHSVTLTSATLATAPDDFSHVQKRLGCESAGTLQLGSPFDHAAQVKLIVDTSMPSPDHPRYVDELLPRIEEHVRATRGGAFVLFTSFNVLNQAAERLREALSAAGFLCLVHGQDGQRGLLLQRFRSHGSAVLFGTASFWQGVDVRGEALRNVIITRLPFDVPDRPLVAARLERIRERGGNPFMEDSVPRAVIRFKQGFGRLIRSSTDRGRVVVLDPRILTKRYGRMFLDALPAGVCIENQEGIVVRGGDAWN